MKRILLTIFISIVAILAVSHLLAGDARSSQKPSVANSKDRLHQPPHQASVPGSFDIRFAPSDLLEAGTPLDFTVARRGIVQLQIFDLEGEEVLTLEQQWRNPGSYSTTWDGRDAQGKLVKEGIYFVRLGAPGVSKTIRIINLNSHS